MNAALQQLASAAATTIYDAIGKAETTADLDNLAKLVWRGYADRAISEDDAVELDSYIRGRRPAHRATPQLFHQPTLPDLPLPQPNLRCVGRFRKRHAQRSPDKQASYERRHRLAYSGVIPHHLAAHLTVGEMAVMNVVADEYRRTTRCESSLGEIAARAGVCRRTARRAMQKARDQHLISIEERPVRGMKHRPNLVKVISLDWLKWLRRPKVSRDESGEAIGGHLVAPTDITTEDDGGGCANDKLSFAVTARARSHRNQTPIAPEAGQSEGRPIKEAVEFAAELANIVGYQQLALPKTWRDADPPQVVQVWLNEIGEIARPTEAIDLLRALTASVMRRKRLSDAWPPFSPRYFSSEVHKMIARVREPLPRAA